MSMKEVPAGSVFLCVDRVCENTVYKIINFNL